MHPSVKATGIDFGIKKAIALADGTYILPINAFAKMKGKLAKLQRRLVKKAKFSKNWYKLLRKIQKLHWHIANMREDYLHKASARLAKTTLSCAWMNCGFTANADYKSALVLKKRGIRVLLDGTVKVKQKKSVRLGKGIKPQIGPGLPESESASFEASRITDGQCVTGQVSVNREAPTSTVSCG